MATINWQAVDRLADAKASKIAEFKALCESTIEAGFTSSNGHTYRTNRDDQINMIGQKDDLSDGTITVVPWNTEDAGYVNHTPDEWLTVYSEAFNYKKKQLLYYNSLKEKVNAIVVSDTVTEDDAVSQVNAITW